MTFDAKIDAEAWLIRQRAEIVQGTWLPPVAEAVSVTPATFGAYAVSWLATRQLAVTTRDHYAQLYRDHIEPAFARERVSDITPALVRAWHAGLATRADREGSCLRPAAHHPGDRGGR